MTLLLALAVLSQAQATPVPGKHIPPTVLMELRALENQFDLALSRDCAPERCVSKGCVYQDHTVVDLPRNSSLPGLGQPEGPGSVPVQEYLTQAHCDFAHEKSVPARDVQALVNRLQQRLSKGWLQVTVGRQILEPISESLRESPPPKPPPEPPKVEAPVPPPAPPMKWEAGVAVRELWLTLLPHFWWMAGIFLLSLATLTIIWGLRRVGRETIEEKAMLAQLAAGTLTEAPKEVEAGEVPAPLPVSTSLALTAGEDAAFVTEQQSRWADRIAEAELAKDESVVVETLRAWLKAGEFALLAKAIFTFGDRLSLAFPSDGEYAMKKVEFSEYLRTVDVKTLPSDADFFKTLNQHAVSSSVLSQSDADTYVSLREEFGAAGVARLVQDLPPRHGALVFAMVPPEHRSEVARALPEDPRWNVATQLLSSNRITREERSVVFGALEAARAGLPVPRPVAVASHEIADRGREYDAAGALGSLLPLFTSEQRAALFAEALDRSNGVFPDWYEDILHPDMLSKLPPELQTDVLLEVDVKALTAWLSLQTAAWNQRFVGQLSQSLQNALKANSGFESREAQLQYARRGHRELVRAVRRVCAGGRASFAALVAA